MKYENSVILVSSPYITSAPSTWHIGRYPVENDVTYHLKTSFKSYDKIKFFEPKWIKNDHEIDLDLDSFDECYNKAKKCSDVINFVFMWNVEPLQYPKMNIILDKLNLYKEKSKIKIISFVPDAWPRGIDIVDFMSKHTEICDKTIVLYEGTIPFLEKKNRLDIASKVQYLHCWPMVFNKNLLENKKTDFCYIGTLYAHRQLAVNKITDSFPDKSLYLFTKGRQWIPHNPLASAKEFVNKIGESTYSIMTGTMLPKMESDFHFPSVLPARLTESVINMTVPIYVQFSEKDRLPRKIEIYNPCIYISIDDPPNIVREKIESISIEEMKINMKRFYDRFVSPESLIPKILY